MDKLTRKELKSDKFALEVQHGVQYVNLHRIQLMRWGGIAAGVAILIVAFVVYRNYQHGVRQEALHQAILTQNANVGPAPNEYVLSFPTEPERVKAIKKVFGDLAAKYPGTEEGLIAEYFLGTNAADQGDFTGAEKHFKLVADSGPEGYASLAKLALAQIYAYQGKRAEGEKIIQSIIDHPTALVSKDAAIISLAELIKNSDPQRARKLLEPLRSSPRPGISRSAITAIGEMSSK